MPDARGDEHGGWCRTRPLNIFFEEGAGKDDTVPEVVPVPRR